MTELVGLGPRTRPDLPAPFVEAGEWFDDVDALVERVQAAPGSVVWVAIAPELADPLGAVERVRASDPGVSFLLLGTGDASLEVLQSELGKADPASARGALETENLASIAALTAGIAHDVGTPMTAILGYAELLAKSVDDEKNRKRARTIVEQVHRVSDLIETLMSLSRTEAREPIRLELGAVLDRALDFYREKLRRHAIEIERVDAAAPAIRGDPTRLNQVFLNLVLNAVDAMPQGGTLRVSLGPSDEGGAEVRLGDSGTPISPELGARVFEPYFSARERVSGRSLGLLVARTIVEDHGGRIELSGQASETEFRLVFPAAE